MTPEQIVQAVQDAGMVGLGGAAFPTHVKMRPPKEHKVDTLVVNGCECEPYLTCDHRLMLERPDDLIAGYTHRHARGGRRASRHRCRRQQAGRGAGAERTSAEGWADPGPGGADQVPPGRGEDAGGKPAAPAHPARFVPVGGRCQRLQRRHPGADRRTAARRARPDRAGGDRYRSRGSQSGQLSGAGRDADPLSAGACRREPEGAGTDPGRPHDGHVGGRPGRAGDQGGLRDGGAGGAGSGCGERGRSSPASAAPTASRPARCT